MDVLLLGNGFDLHHKFPTSYLNFLNVITHLVDNYEDSCATVGSVLGNIELHRKDDSVKKCYEKHKDVYDSTDLPSDKIKDMINRVRNNMWFKYLSGSVTKDIQWIDFEKKIHRVIQAFEALFNCDEGIYSDGNTISFSWSVLNVGAEDKRILSQFDFFCKEQNEIEKSSSQTRHVQSKYLEEQVAASGVYYFDLENVASALYLSLKELGDVLREYLLYFVDAPSKKYDNLGIVPCFDSICPIQYRVFSFNYTNTYEILYHSNRVNHIHGNTQNNIVLGINPDDNDNVESVDTTFLQFKKYYQRILQKTDIEFLQSIRELGNRSFDTTLYVMGHSLDSTDEDIIKQIFESAHSIIILYHNDTSLKNQMKNLVSIYGKAGLDRLRDEKNLQFLLQSEIEWKKF